jgi:molybdopterin biosynthesis enzyme
VAEVQLCVVGHGVAVLSTGDELVEPGKPLGAWADLQQQSAVLIGWLQRLGCECGGWRHPGR